MHENWKERRRPFDTRILRARLQNGKRMPGWKSTALELSEKELAEWLLKVPRTAQWCAEFLTLQPGGVAEHHILRHRTVGLGINDFGVMEHEQIMEALKQAVAHDQLVITSLASFELLPRRAQTIE